MMDKGYVPEHTYNALKNYFDNCWEPGSFLMAVLCNDLMEASFRADHVNKHHLAEIATWVYHTAPRGSWGNKEIVRSWLNHGEHQQRYEKQRVMEILSSE